MSSPLTEPAVKNKDLYRPQWLTWVIVLSMIVIVILASGTLLPQSAKKFVLYPTMIFMFAGIAAHDLAQKCHIRWTTLQFAIVMCCTLAGYLGQQYLSYQQYVVHQRKIFQRESTNLLSALQNELNPSPEQQELNRRVQQQLNPSIPDYFRWKYGLIRWLNTTPPTWIFILETLFTWVLVSLMFWLTTLRQTDTPTHTPATADTGVEI